MMKRGTLLLGLFSILLFASAALAESSAPVATQENCQSYFTHWFSEENNPSNDQHNSAECKSGFVVGGIECDYRYCDNKRLWCIPYTNYCEPDTGAVPSQWSGWFSEEQPNSSYTDSGFMMGTRCEGKYCDRVSIRTFTSQFLPNPGAAFCEWSPHFSEEEDFRECSGNAFVAGLACFDSYCDRISMYCCQNPYADVEVVDVNYDLDAAKILENPPESLASQTLENNSASATATMEFSFSKAITESSWFQNSVGIGLEIGRSFSAGIPFIDGEVESSLAVSRSQERAYGIQEDITKTYTATFTIEVPPCSSVHAEALVSTADLDVPYKMFLESPSTGQNFVREGIWEGVSSWYLRYVIEDEVALATSSCN